MDFEKPEFIEIVREIRDIIYPAVIEKGQIAANADMPAIIKEELKLTSYDVGVAINDIITLVETDTTLRTAEVRMSAITPDGEVNGIFIIASGEVVSATGYPTGILYPMVDGNKIQFQYKTNTPGDISVSAFATIVREQ